MTDFIASNGVEVWVDNEGDIRVTLPGGVMLRGCRAAALREFFLSERDEALGRWRFNDTIVVYPVSSEIAHRAVYVVHENTGQSQYVNTEHMSGVHPDWKDAAQAWADAHPEPKPWQDAKPWETWVLTIDGQEHARTLDEDREIRDPEYLESNSWIHIKDTRITAGRRIWPEAD